MINLNERIARIRQAFRKSFPYSETEYIFLIEIFSDNLIVEAVDSATIPQVKVGQYWRVKYTSDEDASNVTFEPKEGWEIVEKEYKPVSKIESWTSTTIKSDSIITETSVTGRRIKAIGATIDAVNRNNRIYNMEAATAAIADYQQRKQDSSKRGKFLLGENEHPTAKATGRESLQETCIVWDNVTLDTKTKQVLLEGEILPNAQGKQLIMLLNAGVEVGISQRADAISTVEPDGIEHILWYRIRGFDAVASPADHNARILLESYNVTKTELLKLIGDNQELFKGVDLSLLAGDEATKEQLEGLEKKLQTILKVADSKELEAKVAELNSLKAVKADAIQAMLKGSGFDFKDAKPATIEDAQKLIADAQTQKDADEAKKRLNMDNVTNIKPVIEAELGIPAYAGGVVKVADALIKSGKSKHNNIKSLFGTVADGTTPASHRAQQKWLKAYYEMNQRHLQNETNQIADANTRAELTLPYTVVAGVIAEFFPRSVAASVFNFDTMPDMIANFIYEKYERETGVNATLAATAFTAFVPPFTPPAVSTAAAPVWKDLPLHAGVKIANINLGSLTFSSFVEGTDYIVDYANGRVMTLSAPFAAAAGTTTLALTYSAMRKGEMVGIERARMRLTNKIVQMEASRLGVQVSNEAVAFANAQLNYDLVGNAIKNTAADMARQIDKNMFNIALNHGLMVGATNVTTYSNAVAIDAVANGFGYAVGQAKLKLKNRFINPDDLRLVVSTTLMEKMSNSSLWGANAVRQDAKMNSAGYVSTWRETPVYESTEFGFYGAAYSGASEWAMVVHPEMAMYQAYQGMKLKGPYPAYDAAGKLLGQDQWYMEVFDAADVLVADKGSLIKITA